jgi:thymidylate synthase (FAD)
MSKNSKDDSERELSETSPNLEPLPRTSVAAIDAILGRPFHILDNGSVRVIDYMGDDAAVVQAARVSYGLGTKRIRDDRALIPRIRRITHKSVGPEARFRYHFSSLFAH